MGINCKGSTTFRSDPAKPFGTAFLLNQRIGLGAGVPAAATHSQMGSRVAISPGYMTPLRTSHAHVTLTYSLTWESNEQ